MDSVLIVSSNDKAAELLTPMLIQNGIESIMTVKTAGEARRITIEREFDLCIINAPLSDETGEQLSRNIAQDGESQVILLVRAELAEDVANAVEGEGVLVVGKPIQRAVMGSVLRLARASFNRISALRTKNKALLRKIEDIRLIDRAKCILIEYLRMSETEAHHYIEKQAMDMRQTKREVALDILKTYEE
ncbi:MAG: ANTAR domain-containing protein [Clostridia bacterium]|nr:ANTAR domain-containing protein [Clostridia bacterium]